MSGCRFGYVEYDGYQYCFEHHGWRHYTSRHMACDKVPAVTR